jgi:hypothetical protein
MGWIDDVYANEIIYSSQYGNAIRDRTVHQFANKAERNAVAAAAITNGMVCYTATEQTWWLRAGGVWVALAHPPQSFTPHLWQIVNADWVACTVNNILTARVTRALWRIDVALAVSFQSVLAEAGPIAFALPYTIERAGQAPTPVGTGQLTDDTRGHTAGGLAFYAGPITGYPACQITDFATGNTATVSTSTGSLMAQVSYFTDSTADGPLAVTQTEAEAADAP